MINNQWYIDKLNGFKCNIESIDNEQISEEEKITKIVNLANRVIEFCSPCECKREK